MPERDGGTTGPRGPGGWAAAIRRILGMPDYASFVDHMRRRHPDCVVPTEREFFDQYVAARYSGGPTRCC